MQTAVLVLIVDRVWPRHGRFSLSYKISSGFLTSLLYVCLRRKLCLAWIDQLTFFQYFINRRDVAGAILQTAL